jgi:hypothetical protein
MKLGAERKKIAILGALVVIGGYLVYTNVISSGPEPARTPKTAARPSASAPGAIPGGAGSSKAPNITRARAPGRGSASQDFKPTLTPKPEDRPDYTKIDPTLRTDLLDKVQSIEPEGGGRSLFQFAAAPAPKTETIEAKIKPEARFIGPPLPPKPPEAAAPAAPPQAPPISLKFFGFSKPKPDGEKRAFFMDGEEIYVAAEGELVKKRYRVVKIDATSVVMEDTEFKNNRQTLTIQPEVQQQS